MAEADWGKIEAEFRAGASVGEIGKRHGVSIAEILKRAQRGQWRRGEEPGRAIVVHKPTRQERINAKVEEAAADIIRHHKSRTRELRDSYDTLHAEFQELCGHLVSFLDAEQMAKIKAEPDRAKAVKLMTDMLKATGIKFALFERLMNLLTALVAVERRVWGLGDKDSTPEQQTWDDLLLLVQQPSRVPPMPSNVVRFDRAQK